jgi:hypothetical protein
MSDPLWNDPAPDSFFVKLDERTNECSVCGERVENTTEARDGHLSAAEFSTNPKVAASHRALFVTPKGET